ncbi:MAG: amidohydrolase family protein, partial [Alphaproteobacteria bacterium]|nr:amidohydrolase family protein [Alphaproteobacteria bacterium]
HFGKYKDAGVVLAIGTDTIPHNMLEDLRYAAILGRVASRDGQVASTSDVFHAGTVGGARALMRDDIGKLAVGAKADIVVLDTTHPVMAPVRDPIVSLIHSAAERAVRDVYIDGNLVVENHQVLTLDRGEAAGQLAECQARMEAGVPDKDYLGRSSRDIAPLSLPEAFSNAAV